MLKLVKLPLKIPELPPTKISKLDLFIIDEHVELTRITGI